MYYTNEERRIICFLKIDENLSLRKIAERFHKLFPNRRVPTPEGISKMITKLRATRSVFNRPKSARPRTATNEENEIMVIGSGSKINTST